MTESIHRAPRILAGALPGVGWLLAALLLAAPAGAESWYAQRVITGDSPLRVEQLWSDGSSLRAETVVAGRPLLTLVRRDRYYIVDRLSGTGISIGRSPASIRADASRGRPFGREARELLAAGGERVGRERLGARECDRYRFTGMNGKREICVTPDAARLPIQVETWSRRSGQNVIVRYLDWTRGFPVPDKFFEPDPRWQIEHLDYADYRKRSQKEPVGPAPPFYSDLLHGDREDAS